MRRLLDFAFVLILVCASAFGQEYGSIKGTVSDIEGNPLPGVSISLTGSKIGPMSTVSSERGNYRFLSLPVALDYMLKFELAGFKTVTREKLVVSFGRDILLDIAMELAPVEEEVTVIGQTPVIDSKRTQIGVHVTEDMIKSLPTARNPWVILALVPGMLIDREDVGGNEGGQQSAYYGHGSRLQDNTWNIDGASVTDQSALGSAPAYLNIAGYEELQINYGNNDVKSQTGGVQINLVSKKGGNAYSGTFYLDAEDKGWQSENIPKSLKDFGYASAGINRIYLYGASFGGPIVRDRAWFYGSWGVQDIDARTLAGTSDKTWLVSSYARLDFQLASNTRINAFLEYDNKEKWGRTAWGPTQQAPETYWNQTGPGYIWKGEIDQVFGSLYLSLKGVYMNGGFELIPLLGKRTGSGPYLINYHYPTFYAAGNIDNYGTDRNQLNLVFSGNYFAENVLGADHEFKFGVDYVQATVTTYDYYEGNLTLHYYGPEPGFPTGEWWEAWLLRDFVINLGFERYSFFLQDTMSFGRVSLNLGLRFDQEQSYVANYSVPASPWLPQYMRSLEVSRIDPSIKWRTVSPRLSLVYDLAGDGKSVIKLSAARYGSQAGYEHAQFINPVQWTEIDLIWQDLDGDKRVTSSELFGLDWNTFELKDPNDPAYWLWYGGINTADPSSLTVRNEFNPGYSSPLLDEISLSYERELFTDFAGRIEGFYKKSYKEAWTIGRNAAGALETRDNYYVAGVEPITGYNFYGCRAKYLASYYRMNYPNRYDDYKAVQLVLTKRLSNRWMMDASFTLSEWKRHIKGDYIDPQNVEYLDGGVNAPWSDLTSWRGDVSSYVNSRWLFKFSGLYQLPFGINVSGTFVAREGYVMRTEVMVYRPGIGWNGVFGSTGGKGKCGDIRLPSFWVANLRLEKVFSVSDRFRVALSVDAFNVSNSAHSLERQTRLDADDYGRDMRILNPRVFRFGVRFDF